MITDSKFLIRLERLSILHSEDPLAEKISKINDPKVSETDLYYDEVEENNYKMELSDAEFYTLLFNQYYEHKDPFVYCNSPVIEDLTIQTLPDDDNFDKTEEENLEDNVKSKQNSEEVLNVSFPEKFSSPKKAGLSALSDLLHTSIGVENPLSKYSFVGGSTIESSLMLNIILPFSNSKLTVQVIKSAMVSDVIGFILMKYIEKGIKPVLSKSHQNPDMYELKIADDDGEIDEDFPAVDKNRQMSVFQFKTFGLVALEKDNTANDGPKIIFIRVHLYSTIDIRHTTTVKCDPETLLSTIHETVCKKRQVSPDIYFLFLSDMKTSLDVSKSVSTLNGITELVMLRKSAGNSAGDVFLAKKQESDNNFDELKKMPKKLTNSADTSIYRRYLIKVKSTFGKPERIFCIDGEYIMLMPLNMEASDLPNVASVHVSKILQVVISKADKLLIIHFLKSEGNLGKTLEFEVSNATARRNLL
eukprot:NODE_10_length_61504_cov_0.956502.p13 type:complete len:474 gc:universal NODE_10_length_61504_cov_0.956502:27316-25895(-)